MGRVPTFCISGAVYGDGQSRLDAACAPSRPSAWRGSYGLEIFDVQLRRESIGMVLRVIIDRPDRGVPEPPEDAVGIADASASART